MNNVSSWFTNISKQITEFTTIPPEDDLPPKKEQDKPQDDAEKEPTEEGDVKADKEKEAEAEADEKPMGLPSSLSLGELKAEEVLKQTREMGSAMGTALWGWTRTAGSRVAETATAVASQLEEGSKGTILGDFEAEQRRFVEAKERESLGGSGQAGVAPWVGHAAETELKKRILALSLDTRNFLRDPPGDSDSVDLAALASVAAATLQEDPNLRKMRFHLVPKQLKEERFWRNYFYRVNLVKQSAAMESLATEEEAAPSHSPGTSRSASEKSWAPKDEEDPEEAPRAQALPREAGRRTESGGADGGPDEFVSDGVDRELTEEELEKVRQELGLANQAQPEEVGPEGQDAAWEQELLADLNDFELVDQAAKTDQDWEKEISDLLLAEDLQTDPK